MHILCLLPLLVDSGGIYTLLTNNFPFPHKFLGSVMGWKSIVMGW